MKTFVHEEHVDFLGLEGDEKDQALNALMRHLGLELTRVESFDHGDSQRDHVIQFKIKEVKPNET